MRPTARVVVDMAEPGAAGLMLREMATAESVRMVAVTHRAWSHLRRDCGGDKRAAQWLASLATEAGKVVAVNFELKDGGSRTMFLAPKDWSEEKLRGYIGGLGEEVEAIFGPVAGVSGAVA
jgi:hypothetical protein